MGLLELLIVVLIVAALFGGFGHARGWPVYGAWSPVGLVILVILLVLLFRLV